MVIELIAIIGSAVATIVTVVYKAGQLEGRILTRLDEHDRRLTRLEASPLSLHGGV